jgi:hypothetical protein
MNNFIKAFVDWLYQNNEVVPLAISDYFVLNGKLQDIAEKIYKGNKTLSKKYGFSGLGEENDYQLIFATEDFAPLFCYYNEFYNGGESNPNFSSTIMNNYKKSTSVKNQIASVNPEKWRMLAIKVSDVYTDIYSFEGNPISEFLNGDCHHLGNGEFIEYWEN